MLRLILMCPAGDLIPEEKEKAITDKLTEAGVEIIGRRKQYFEIRGDPELVRAMLEDLPGWLLGELRTSREQ